MAPSKANKVRTAVSNSRSRGLTTGARSLRRIDVVDSGGIVSLSERKTHSKCTKVTHRTECFKRVQGVSKLMVIADWPSWARSHRVEMESF